MHLFFHLATPTADPASIRSIFVWSGVLVGLILVAFAGYSYFKRWMNSTDESVKVGFTLSDLRELHKQGKMSDQEYELTRANMLKAAKSAVDRMPEVLPGQKAPARAGAGKYTSTLNLKNFRSL